MLKYGQWNPLTDDGDALRLAVKLTMDLEIMNWRVQASLFDGEMAVEPVFNSNHCAATRRAITRAAAEIGKAMP
jgi:hypothetical protein